MSSLTNVVSWTEDTDEAISRGNVDDAHMTCVNALKMISILYPNAGYTL